MKWNQRWASRNADLLEARGDEQRDVERQLPVVKPRTPPGRKATCPSGAASGRRPPGRGAGERSSKSFCVSSRAAPRGRCVQPLFEVAEVRVVEVDERSGGVPTKSGSVVRRVKSGRVVIAGASARSGGRPPREPRHGPEARRCLDDAPDDSAASETPWPPFPFGGAGLGSRKKPPAAWWRDRLRASRRAAAPAVEPVEVIMNVGRVHQEGRAVVLHEWKSDAAGAGGTGGVLRRTVMFTLSPTVPRIARDRGRLVGVRRR